MNEEKRVLNILENKRLSKFELLQIARAIEDYHEVNFKGTVQIVSNLNYFTIESPSSEEQRIIRNTMSFFNSLVDEISTGICKDNDSYEFMCGVVVLLGVYLHQPQIAAESDFPSLITQLERVKEIEY